MKLIKKKDIDKLPEKEGVYFIWNNKELLYIGRSINIKRRIKNHVYPSYLENALVNPKEIKFISFQILRNHEETKRIENSLLSIFDTKNNNCDNWYCHRKFKIKINIDDIRDKIMKVKL